MSSSQQLVGVSRAEFYRRMDAAEGNAKEASNLAREALLKLAGHEQRCTDRYDNIAKSVSETARSVENMASAQSDSFARVHTRIDEMLGRWLVAGLGLIGLLATVIGYLLTVGVPWK